MIKKVSSILISAFMALSITFNCFAQTEYKEIEIPVPDHMLFLGDSIASGYGLDGYDIDRDDCFSYSNILKNQYTLELKNDCDFSMKNLAIDGATSTDLLEFLQEGQYDSYLKKTDCVVISIGGNDLLGVMLETLASVGISTDVSESTGFNLEFLIGNIRDMSQKLDDNLAIFNENITEITKYINSKSNATILVQTLYNPFENFNGLETIQEFSQKKIDTLNSTIVENSTVSGNEYLVCDVAKAFKNHDQELTRINDMDIHPNAKGHKVISECVDQTIRSQVYSYKMPIEVSAGTVNSKKSKMTDLAIASIIIISAIFVFLAIRMFIARRINKKLDI